MKVLCVIPAGGGSRSAPLRNLRLLAGKPLLAYTAETALAAARLSRVVLSTDDEDVAEAGRRCGLESLLRPAGLPREKATLQWVAQDAVRRLEEAGERCDAVCILDPGSPFRRPEDVDRCIELLQRTRADSVVTVVPVPREYHPHTVYLRAADGSLRLSTGPAAPVGAAEELPPVFHRDGSVCVIRRDVLMNGNSLFGERTVGYVVDPVSLVKLDRPEEWGRAERIAKLGTHRATSGRIAPLAGPRRNLAAGWVATPIADPLVPADVGPLKEGALGFSPVMRGKYLEPARKVATPRCRESETPFAIREALLPPESRLVARAFLDPIRPALVIPRPQPGRAPSVSRIEDPFRPRPELLPDVRTAEAPLVAALAARGLGGSGLGRAPEPRRQEIGGGSQVRSVAAPIALTGPLGKAAGRLRPVQPFTPMVAGLGPAVASQARNRPSLQLPPALVSLRAARPREPASSDLRASERLAYTPALRREGRLLAQPARCEITRVEVLNTHPAQLPGAWPLVIEHRLTGVPPALVRNRMRERARTWLSGGWALFGRESAVVALGSIRSRAQGVAWPTAKAFLFARQREWPAKAWKQAKIEQRESPLFPVRAASLPASAGLPTRMPDAPPTKIPALSIWAGARTPAGAAPLAEFRRSGEPEGTPLFKAVPRVALMPQGVFHYIAIEDHDDYATWARAPYHPAVLLIRGSGCSVGSCAGLAAAGCEKVFAGPYAGETARCLRFEQLPAAHKVVVTDSRTDILAMDFAAIAEASSPRWPFSLRKTAGSSRDSELKKSMTA